VSSDDNLVGKEGCNAGSGTQSIVASKLSYGKSSDNCLVVVAID